jgi:cytochrome c-type protein NapC
MPKAADPADDLETARPPRPRVGWGLLVLAFLAGWACIGVVNFAIEYTNTLEFCTSCHTMQTNFLEYRESMHFKNPSGVQATCSDCHVPKALLPMLAVKIVAAKDVVHQVLGTIDTPEKFEARRWVMANRIWTRMKATDSRECRTCHDFANMELSGQDRIARSRHSRAQDKGQTCIDCHKGVVHTQPDPPEDPATPSPATGGPG